MMLAERIGSFYSASGVTADRLLAVMAENSAENKLSLYNEHITSINYGLFWASTSLAAGNNNWLEEVVFPNCTEIGYRAFFRCSSLRRIILPSLSTISKSNATGVLQYLSSLEELDVGNVQLEAAISLTGANVSGFTLRVGNAQRTGSGSIFSIPTTVTGPVNLSFYGSKIGKDVAKDCVAVKSVHIADTVREIGSSAFSGCTGITRMELPSRLRSIPSRCFEGCTGLTDLKLPDIVEYAEYSSHIGNFAFRNCTGLVTITLPRHMSSYLTIGDSVFSGCTNLKDVYYPYEMRILTVFSSYPFGLESGAVIHCTDGDLVVP